MLLKQNSCHLDGSSCLLFLVIFLVYLTRGGSNGEDALLFCTLWNRNYSSTNRNLGP